MSVHERYASPLAERYASMAMLRLWSPQTRYGIWRRLWLALAEAEKDLGVPIPDDAIFKEIESMEKKEFGSKLFTEFEDRFQFFLVPALLLLILEFFISDRKTTWFSRWNMLRKLPE